MKVIRINNQIAKFSDGAVSVVLASCITFRHRNSNPCIALKIGQGQKKSGLETGKREKRIRLMSYPDQYGKNQY